MKSDRRPSDPLRQTVRWVKNVGGHGGRILAGVEYLGFIRLYREDETGYSCSPITHEEWMAVLDELGAEPGELIEVSLYRMREYEGRK